ncbi:hypothetical protein [Tsuneonella sp. HG222]
MLKSNPELPVELPQVGSFGFLRGTAQRAQVLRRNRDTNPPTCMVKLFERRGIRFDPVRDASGNTEVEERDLYATPDLAAHAGRKARRRAPRRRTPGTAGRA